jgi:uncharacterized protein
MRINGPSWLARTEVHDPPEPEGADSLADGAPPKQLRFSGKRIKVNGDSIIGVISDTHGMIRFEMMEALKSVDMIIHAGDIGNRRVIEDLRSIAPVVAVRGNTDAGEWAEALPRYEVVQIGETFIYVIHDINELDQDPGAAGFSAVIYGHSHRPSYECRDGVIFLNPGSAGPQRFELPIGMAMIHLKDGILEPRLIELNPGGGGMAR